MPRVVLAGQRHATSPRRTRGAPGERGVAIELIGWLVPALILAVAGKDDGPD